MSAHILRGGGCGQDGHVDLDAVADELYALWPAEFTAARTAREKEARAAGDRALAAQIKALGKPTTVAWLANRLVRDHGDELRPLLELGDALREATAVLRGEDLRRLSQQQHQLVAALVRQARRDAAADGHRVGEDAARGLEEKLRAALADAGLAEQLTTGRLTGQLRHSGFTPGDGGGPASSGSVSGPGASKPVPPRPAVATTTTTAKASGVDAAAQREADRAAEEERLAVARDRAERDLAGARLQAAEAAGQLEAATAEVAEAAEVATGLDDRVAELRAELERATAQLKEVEKRHKAAGPALAKAERAVRVADRLVADREARLAELNAPTGRRRKP